MTVGGANGEAARGMGGWALASAGWGRRSAIALLAIVVGCAAVAAIAVATLRPPTSEVLLLSLYLLGSGGLSLAIGYVGLALLRRSGIGGLRLRLAYGQALVLLVAFVNIVVTALLMFISDHDLALLGLLLLYAALMSVFFALALADEIGGGVRAVAAAARQMAAGDLGARATVGTRDELGALSAAFNAMAEQLQSAAERQREAEAARRYLVAAVSHDLRTPLASIRAMVEAITDGVVVDEATVARYMQTIGAEVERLRLLINDLFELSQIDAGALELRFERGSLHDLISDTLRFFGAEAEQRAVHLAGSVHTALPPVLMDGARVQRVLDNLVGNALRHTPAGGTVEIRADVLRTAETVVQGNEAAEAAVVQVTVQDSGEGIPPHELPNIFQPFYRGDAARSRSAGGGLGLTIARGIVELHGGRLWVESAPGRGAAFHFSLPAQAEL